MQKSEIIVKAKFSFGEKNSLELENCCEMQSWFEIVRLNITKNSNLSTNNFGNNQFDRNSKNFPEIISTETIFVEILEDY